MLKFNPPQKFYDENIFQWLEEIQGKSFTLNFDKNELSFYCYDTLNLKEEFKNDELVFEKDKFVSLLVFDADNQAHFVLNYKEYLKNVEAHPLSKGMSYFKFKRECEKIQDTEHFNNLTICQINWSHINFSTFGFHKDGEITHFMDSNYQLKDASKFKEYVKEKQWDSENESKYFTREIINNKIDIQEWLKVNNIHEYTIHENLVVDVHQNVRLSNSNRGHVNFIPFQFGKIDGNFMTHNLTLKDLEGFPSHVEGDFDVFGSSLKSLKGGPQYVGGFYDIMGNFLNSYEFCPIHVGGRFKGFDNPIKSLDFLPKYVGDDLDITNSRLKELDLNAFKDVDIGKNLVISRRIGIPFEGFEHLYIDDKLVLSKVQINKILLKDKLDGDLSQSPTSRKMKI